MRQTRLLTWSSAGIALSVLSGCQRSTPSVAIQAAFPGPTTLAVAPVLNFSGEFQVDPIKAADLLASELSYVKGISVLPVNRVVAVLAGEGRQQVESPAHALRIADSVGADAILVAGITEYDAYTPVVGLILQLYAPGGDASLDFDPINASRMSESFELARMTDPLLPTSQIQLVNNGAHEAVRDAVQRYAQPRLDAEESYLGWRKYLKVQTLFLRFCWNDAINRLMYQERSRRMFADANSEEAPA